MSNEQEHIEEHSSPIKTPKQLIVTIVLSFVIPIAIIILLVNMVASGTKVGAGSDSLSNEAVAKRIAPVAGFELVDANAPKVFKTGEQVFAAVCTACHTAGVAGAPKVGDNAAWAPFITAGYDAMLNVALHGKGGMPAKGGNPTLSDYEVARAVVYMANKSGGSLPEPAAPAAEGDKKEAAAAPAAAAPAAAATAPAAPAAAAPAAAAPAPAPAPAAQAAAPQAATVNPAGEKLYKSVCFACHATGVANAPKFGDKAAWEPYIKTGMDAMVKVAMQGKPPMPPKGGAANASEDDIRAAVQYMVDAAK
ncbi:c-type cytochrome [Achromobacter insolitus]|jgi:cytochrome c5|uniref:Cytochrome c6 n=6 Tax=Achromobacter insolitus TaxID=217204 RepID=A0A6S7FM17_9BURK|nr:MULTISPECIES: c-type cytochrome [Achromobacter]GLK95550.1 cytochrome c [Achromobacter xylosoxidans]APX78255.1 cytochrome c5 family protein [Achromobacter insolitus]AVG41766.1 cytochrome c5 family protein [Achromobacter insolitus]MCP1400785.1 cytochrome c5 [Achromobacter insolitus]MDH3062090.1 c-type cytochrome [Achromobacter insolitus]